MIKHDLILTIVNRGFADEVMSAAKAAGAFGGTVVNARGTGTHELQHFSVRLFNPKRACDDFDRTRKRNSIMEAICRDAGLSKEGMGICFSLPVDGVAGIRSISNLDDRKEKEKSDTPEEV